MDSTSHPTAGPGAPDTVLDGLTAREVASLLQTVWLADDAAPGLGAV